MLGWFMACGKTAPHFAGIGQELAPVVSEDDSSDGRRKVPANKFSTTLVRSVLVQYIPPSAPTHSHRRGASAKTSIIRFRKSNFPS